MFLTLLLALYKIGLMSRCLLGLFVETDTLHIDDSFEGRNTPSIFASQIYCSQTPKIILCWRCSVIKIKNLPRMYQFSRMFHNLQVFNYTTTTLENYFKLEKFSNYTPQVVDFASLV